MFKKLKQRLETDESVESSPRRSSSLRSLNQSDDSTDDDRAGKKMPKQSRRSIDQSMNLNERSSKEEIFSALMQRTTQVKKLEIKLADYGRSLKDITHERDKLASALEKQQDSAMRRLSELNDASTEVKHQFQSAIRRLEKSEKELLKQNDSLTQENGNLKSSLKNWVDKKDEFEKSQEEFYSKREVSDELQDLQVQESAKIKHLLMNSEKECKRLQNELDVTLAEYLQLQEQHTDLETRSMSLTDAHKKINDEVKELRNQNETLSKSLSVVKLSFSEQQKANTDLQHENASANAKLQKATRDNEEKDRLLKHAQTKLQNLESRAKNENLPQDEKMQALIAERRLLENRLEESHQQLNNIKSTWSAKINQLETQVAHLNTKITEDTQEYTENLKMLEDKRNELNIEVISLKKKVDELTHDRTQLSQHAENIVIQISELDAKVIEQETLIEIEKSKNKKFSDKMKSKSNDLETKLKGQIKQLQDDKDELKNIIGTHEEETKRLTIEKGELSSAVQNIKNDMNELQDQLTSKEMELQELLKSLKKIRGEGTETRKLNEELQNSIKQKEETISQLKQEVGTKLQEILELEETLKPVQLKLESFDEKLSTVSTNFDEAQQENEKLKNELKSHTEANENKVNEANEKLEELNEKLQSRENELMECKQKIAELKNLQSEDSSEVEELKNKENKLEEKLLQKDRTLKVQQQKMNDLKKALAKELNKRVSSTNGSKTVDTESIMSVVNGNGDTEIASLDDSSEQQEVTTKYLKHLVLKFLSCTPSESTQLIKALSMILKLSRDEEKLLKEVVIYKNSWFSSKPPPPRGIVKPSVRNVKPSVRNMKR